MTEAAQWNAQMLAQMGAQFPWRADPVAGRWYLKNKRGDTLAQFNLDSGHACRLAASAPDLLVALHEAAAALEGTERWVRDSLNLDGTADDIGNDAAKVRAAIAKAKGEDTTPGDESA